MDDEVERVIREPDKPAQSKGPGKQTRQLEWDSSNQVYTSEPNREVVETKIIREPENIELYYKDNYSELFDEWDETIDECNYYGGESFGVVYLTRERQQSVDETTNEIEPGFYEPTSVDHQLVLRPMEKITQDEYIDLEVGINELQSDMVRFFEKENVFNELNMKHKRSSLLYGKPGTGKTFNAIHMCKKAVNEYNAVVIVAPPKSTSFKKLTNKFRMILHDKPVIFVIEEMTEAKGKKEQILSFLDGEYSWNHMYAIGTTNYPGELDKNIVDRPGRFDKVIEVNTPDKATRKKYLETVTDRRYTDSELEMTDGFSFSYLKELVLRMELEDKNFETVVNEFEALKREIDDAFQDTGDTGFI